MKERKEKGKGKERGGGREGKEGKKGKEKRRKEKKKRKEAILIHSMFKLLKTKKKKGKNFPIKKTLCSDVFADEFH